MDYYSPFLVMVVTFAFVINMLQTMDDDDPLAGV
jgi:hypothetical protein